jgi:Tfp pilus assembly protein PilO
MNRWLTFSGRERRLSLVAGVLCGSWLLVTWGVQPLWQRSEDLRQHVERQSERLHGIARLLGHAQTIEEHRQQLGAYFTAGADEETRALLTQLETLSRTSDVRLNLKPRAAQASVLKGRVEVELEVEGAQPAILRFIDGLTAMPRLITIDQLRLMHAPTKDRILRASFVIQQVLVR